METAEVKYTICRAEFDRIEAAYNRYLDRINIALLVSNAAVGFIFLAPDSGAIESLAASSSSANWLYAALVALIVAIGISLYLSWQQLSGPFLVESFDSDSDSGAEADEYLNSQVKRYLTWFKGYEKELRRKRGWLAAALLLTMFGILMYIVARLAVSRAG